MKLHCKLFQAYQTRLFLELKHFLPLLFLVLLLTSLFYPKTVFEKTKDLVMDNFSDKTAHEVLGNYLLSTNQLSAAETEHRLANSSKLNQIIFLKSQPAAIQGEIITWQKIVDQLPNYRDGYLKIALLNYQLNRLFDAKKILTKSLEIDPNNETAMKLLDVLR